MKARKLQQLLNTTRVCSDHRDYIAVGSAMVHNLFEVNKQTLRLRYALESHGGAPQDRDQEIHDIWNGLKALVDSGEIKDIIEGNDELETKLPVFFYENGQVVSEFTDHWNWNKNPVTHTGKKMYTNTHFHTYLEAVNEGIEEETSYVKMLKKRREEKLKDLSDLEAHLLVHGVNLKKMQDEKFNLEKS